MYFVSTFFWTYRCESSLILIILQQNKLIHGRFCRIYIFLLFLCSVDFLLRKKYSLSGTSASSITTISASCSTGGSVSSNSSAYTPGVDRVVKEGFYIFGASGTFLFGPYNLMFYLTIHRTVLKKWALRNVPIVPINGSLRNVPIVPIEKRPHCPTHKKASDQSDAFKKWKVQGSNLRPFARQASALPAELTFHPAYHTTLFRKCKRNF